MKLKDLSPLQKQNICEFFRLGDKCSDKCPFLKVCDIDSRASTYYCYQCCNEFENPDSYEDHVGDFWGQPAYETRYVCPICGNEAIYRIDEIKEGAF